MLAALPPLLPMPDILSQSTEMTRPLGKPNKDPKITFPETKKNKSGIKKGWGYDVLLLLKE